MDYTIQLRIFDCIIYREYKFYYVYLFIYLYEIKQKKYLNSNQHISFLIHVIFPNIHIYVQGLWYTNLWMYHYHGLLVDFCRKTP